MIADDETGGFTVAWQSWPDVSEGDLSPMKYDIYARRFDASGAPVSGEIPVNTTTHGSQEEPAIAGDGSGGFVVAWIDGQPDGAGFESSVRVRRFDASGQSLGGEITVGTSQTGLEYSPAITHDEGGGFTVAWENVEGGGATPYRILARRFDVSGNPLGSPIVANTPVPTKLDSPDIAATETGGFVATWVGRDPQESRTVVFMRRFDAAGTPTCPEREREEAQGKVPAEAMCPEVPVNPSFALKQIAPAIIAIAGGGFDIAWNGEVTDGIYVRPFYLTGEPKRGPVRVDPPTHSSAADPAIAADPNGGFTVAWRGSEEPGSPERVFARRFADGGVALTTAVPLDPGSGFPDQPAIVGDGSGGFAVAWVRQLDLEQGGRDVFARQFVGVPETSIEAGPQALTNEVNPTFRFASDTEFAKFQCRLDGGQFFLCESPLRIAPPLSDGPHTFEVRATNGTIDQSPAASSFTVDTVGPDVEIESGPSGVIDESSPSVTFSSGDPNATFECKVDLDAYEPCSPPLVLGPLGDGPHSFIVRSRDPAGNFSLTMAAREFAIDTHPPTVSILAGPEAGATINDVTPTFDFDANEAVTFECRIDAAAPEPCGPPFTTAPLADGPHVFALTGTDLVGLTSSKSREFTVDTTAPETKIASGPSGPINSRTPTFAFGADEPGAAFECRVDDGAFRACSSPDTTSGLLDGPHTFSVRALDEIGNADATPASRSFIVDTVAPDTAIDSGPSSLGNDPTPTFGFGSSEPGSTYECSLNSAPFTPCGSPYTSVPLSDGSHTFDVRAIDRVSNTDPIPASEAFIVDTRAPSVRVRAGKRQSVERPIRVTVSCTEDCALIVTGRVSVPRAGTFGLRTVRRKLEAGRGAMVSLKPRGAKPPKGPDGRVVLKFRATDRAGNTRKAGLRVPLAGP